MYAIYKRSRASNGWLGQPVLIYREEVGKFHDSYVSGFNIERVLTVYRDVDDHKVLLAENIDKYCWLV